MNIHEQRYWDYIGGHFRRNAAYAKKQFGVFVGMCSSVKNKKR